MADEPVPTSPTPPEEPPSAATSPAPTEVAGTPADGAATAPGGAKPVNDSLGLATDALVDGTVPTVLQKGGANDKKDKLLKKGKAGSLNSVYRRADVTTTLFTFLAAMVAAGIVLGAYYFFTHSKAKSPTAKITGLTSTQLGQLNSFFSGNSAGSSAEVLTVSSSSLFSGRVAVNNDVKITGALSVNGATSLADLVVDKTSTLGTTQIRGALTVSGTTNLQSPAVFSAGASVNGNITVSGNGSFGGSLSAGLLNVTNLSILGNLNLAGHLNITGSNPSASAEGGAGSGATASVDGNDAAGTVTVNTTTVSGTPGSGVQMVKVTFRTAYAKTPRIIISPITLSAGAIGYYIIKTSTYFIIASSTSLTSGTGYSFDYWVIQ